MSGKSAFGEALYDLYRTYCDRKGLPRERGVSQFQVDAETGPGKLDRVLRGDRHWVSARMIETILEGLYNEGGGILTAGERALWRKHLHTMRVLTILVHSFRTEVVEDESAILPEPLIHQLKSVSHRSYETVIAAVEKASRAEGVARGGFEQHGYGATGSVSISRDEADEDEADEDGYAPHASPIEHALGGSDDTALNGRTSGVRDAHRRAVERQQSAQPFGGEQQSGYRVVPEYTPAVGLDTAVPDQAVERPSWIVAIRSGWRRLRASSRPPASRVSVTTPGKTTRPPIPFPPRRTLATRKSTRRPVAGDGRPYPLALDWREIVAWLASKEEHEIVSRRNDPERCLLAVYLHARDGIDVALTVRYSFVVTSATLRWQHPDTGFWVERPLASWERALCRAEETWGWSSLLLRAGDELEILRHAIGQPAVDHVVGAVRAQNQFRNDQKRAPKAAHEPRWSSVGDD